MNTLKSFITYALSTAVVVGLACLFGAGESFLKVYWPLSFFIVAGLDFYRSQVVEGGASEVPAYACARSHRGVYLDQWGFVRVDCFGSPRAYPAATADPLSEPPCNVKRSLGDNFVDRALGYIFVAPFIMPAKVYQALTSR